MFVALCVCSGIHIQWRGHSSYYLQVGTYRVIYLLCAQTYLIHDWRFNIVAPRHRVYMSTFAMYFVNKYSSVDYLYDGSCLYSVLLIDFAMYDPSWNTVHGVRVFRKCRANIDYNCYIYIYINTRWSMYCFVISHWRLSQ